VSRQISVFTWLLIASTLKRLREPSATPAEFSASLATDIAIAVAVAIAVA
jgi:hypothetical protein